MRKNKNKMKLTKTFWGMNFEWRARATATPVRAHEGKLNFNWIEHLLCVWNPHG